MNRHFILLILMLFSSRQAEAKSWLSEIDEALFGKSSDISNYNDGVSLYRAGNLDEAQSKFQMAATTSDRELKAKALHNSAIVHMKKKELQAALDQSKEALAYDNENKPLQETVEKLEKMLAEEKQQAGDQNDQKQAENGDQKQSDPKGEEKSAEEKEGRQEDSKGQEQVAKEDPKGDQESAKEDKDGDQKAAQEGKEGEEKSAEESQKEGEQGSKASDAGKGEQKSADSKIPLMQEGPSKDGESTILTDMEIKQQEAERILRGIDDKIGQYPLTDTEATGKGDEVGKNW